MIAKELLGAVGNAAESNYIEDVFSTHLYTGNSSTQTINNGIDLAGKGGLVWIKSRSLAENNMVFDTARGVTQRLFTDNTNGQSSSATSLTAFNSNGFSISSGSYLNTNAATYASWTFRKQPKFFDVVTYTGNGVAGREIAHNLGSAPAVIIVKSTDNAVGWVVYHSSLGATKYLTLNLTDGAIANPNYWNDTEPTSTNFTVAGTFPTNRSGYNYVAYIFAHNAGGFGVTGTDNVVSCGSYTGTGEVNLGWEPQWLLIKRSDDVSDWRLYDTMRGWTSSGDVALLRPNLSNAEAAVGGPSINATGFTSSAGAATYIYIAIRRGPMKVPTDGTKVFAPVTRTGTNAASSITGVGFPPDMVISKASNNDFSIGPAFFDKLRGPNRFPTSNATSAETVVTDSLLSFNQDGVSIGADNSTGAINFSGSYINWAMRRAPSFFDEVCYTGNGSYPIYSNHNLGVPPELIITKSRNNANIWVVWQPTSANPAYTLSLNTTAAQGSGGMAIPATSTDFMQYPNQSGRTFVAYLFATCPGVSKVGSYTGTGTTQTINCGFAAGARFVLIKRTDSTGDWYVWDSARGIVSANDPHLSLNSTAAEVTSNDSVDPASTGFIVNQVAATNINVTSASYIFLAIA